MLEDVLGFEEPAVAEVAVVHAGLRVAQLEVEGPAPGVSVRVGEHLDVLDVESVEAQTLAARGVHVELVHFDGHLLGRGEAELEFAAEVEAAVSGVVTSAEVFAEAPRDVLLELVFAGLQGFGEV